MHTANAKRPRGGPPSARRHSRSGAVIASSNVGFAADEVSGLAQGLVADSVSHPHAGGRRDGQRAAGAGTGRRHRPREEREVDGRQVWQVAHPPPSPGAPERAGYHHHQGLRDRASIAGLLGCGPKARSPMGHSKACFRSPQNGRLVYTDPQAGNQMSDMPANEPSRGTPCGLQFYSQPSE